MKRTTLFLGSAMLMAATAFANGNLSPITNVRTANFDASQLSTARVMADNFKKGSDKSLKSDSRRPARVAGSEGWTSIGTGTYTDAILPDVFSGISVATWDVEIEQNDADPTTYRIVNPYANFVSPYTDVVYNENMTNYLVFHIYNNQYAYIEDFNTGVEFVDENETLGQGDDYYIKVVSQAASLIENNGIETVVGAAPEVMATYTDGVIKQNAKFTLNGSQYYSLLVAWGNTEEGYYAGNTSGSFCITLPGKEIPKTEWNAFGTGKFTDDFLASLFSDVDPETMEVEIEQDAADPNHYRIPNPYANHSVGLPDNGTGEFEFYVVNDTFVYFTKMNTGLSFNGENLSVTMNVSNLIDTYGAEAVYELYPDAFPSFNNGFISCASTYFDGDGTDYPIFLISYSGTKYLVNKENKFAIEFPSQEVEDPYNWQPYGTGKFTDDFLASFLPDTPVSTFDVEVQRDADDTSHFRLVNPYANWENPSYAATAPGVAEFYIVNNAYAYFPRFITGVRYNGQVLEVSQNVMGPINNGMSLDDVISIFPESLCKYENGVLTATTTFDNGGTPFSVFQIPYDNILNRVNLAGEFRLELPADTPDAVSEINADINAAPVYYNLQGVRVDNPAAGLYIRVCGDRAEKVLVK